MAGPLKSGRKRGPRNKTVGELRERVRIERLASSLERADSGAEIPAWETVDTVWASVDPTGGSEQMTSGQVQANARYVVVARWLDEVTPKDRLVWVTNGNKVLNIVSVGDSVGTGNSLEINCVREV